MSIRRIYPDQYKTSRPRRRLADAVMARAGVDKSDVCSIKAANGKWYVNCFKRNTDGKHHLTSSRRCVAREVVIIPLTQGA